MENFLSDQQTVGTLLREERERQGKTISDVSESTHIRRAFLEYIEDDHFDLLPSKLHITGFLSVYSHYLGISEQLVMSTYKRQMLLLKDLPAEEIFAIPQGSLKKQWTMRPWIYILGFVVVFAVVSFFIYKILFSSSQSAEKVHLDVLTPEHNLIFSAKEGENFSFLYNGKTLRYQLLDVTERAVTLMNVNRQMTLPPFLYTEALEYDEDGNREYDYMIYIREKSQDSLSIGVKMIHTVRNPGQDSYGIVELSNINEAVDRISGAKKGVLTLQNKSKHDFLIIMEGLQGDLSYNKISSNQTSIISYFDEQVRPLYKAIFLQDVGSVQVSLDGKSLSSSSKLGVVAFINCSAKNKSLAGVSCSINEGV